jgi:hypothetical protein
MNAPFGPFPANAIRRKGSLGATKQNPEFPMQRRCIYRFKVGKALHDGLDRLYFDSLPNAR